MIEQREPSQAEVAAMIADELKETEAHARQQIEQIVIALGRTQARQLLAMAQENEANGGEMLPDDSRRRTVGGIFFKLAYTIGQPKPGKDLPPRTPRPWPKKATETAQKSLVQAETTKDTAKKPLPKGKASTVKITLVGRPGFVFNKGQFVIVTMEDSKAPALPKGLPMPPSSPTKYGVHIALKQWKKVEEAATDPEDVLIIEGYPKIDLDIPAIAVYATNVTSKKIQIAQKEAQKQAALCQQN